MSKLFRTKKARRQAVILILIILVVVLMAVYGALIRPLLNKEEVTYKDEQVERGTLTVGVTESGNIDFGTITQSYDLDLSLIYEDDEDEDEDEDSDDEESVEKYLVVEAVNVAQGERINEGDLLFTFTDDSIASVRKLLAAKETDARLDLADAKADYNTNVASAKLDYSLATTDAEYAADIYAASSEALGSDIVIKQADLSTAKTELAKLNTELAQLNADSDYASECSTALSNYNTARYNWDVVSNNINASTYFSLYNAYTQAKQSYENCLKKKTDLEDQIVSKQEEIEKLTTELSELQNKAKISALEVQEEYSLAQVNGQTAEDVYNSTVYSLQSAVDEAQDALDEITELSEEFETFVGNGNIYAEGSGIVTEVGLEEGDKLENQITLVSYAPEDDMTITVNVSQEDIVDLSVGDTANVVFTAYPDEIYEGIIESITTTQTSGNTVTVSYPVIISIHGETDKLYDGMTADVTFVTDTREDILYVSKKAIVTENQSTYVYMLADTGEIYLKEVTTGFSDGIHVEITDGLSDGDTVYIPMN